MHVNREARIGANFWGAWGLWDAELGVQGTWFKLMLNPTPRA